MARDEKYSKHVDDAAEGEEMRLPNHHPANERPKHFDVDMDDLFEVLERKNLDRLRNTYDGIQGLMSRLNTHPERGIDSNTVEKRKAQFGINELKKKESVSFFEFLFEELSDAIHQMLLVSAVVSIVFGLTLADPYSGKVDRETGWINGFAIICSVTVVALMGSINNYQKAKRFEEMEAEQAVFEVQVFRDGEEVTIKSNQLVVGDIMTVEGGMKLSCDYLFVQGSDLKCNESAMTGEPDIIEKSADKDPFFLSGTALEEGNGRLLVIGVGMNSYQGKMKEATDEEPADTPLQEHLAALADDVGKVGMVMAFLLVAALFIKEGVEISNGKTASATNFLNFFIIAVTIIVVAIPEGLPLAVTISLAFSMKSMMKDNCMVRVLASCETMGAATAICSDKTGTLTTNEMTVVQGLVACEEFMIDGYGLHQRNGGVNVIDRSAKGGDLKTRGDLIDQFCFAMAINSTAREAIIDHKLTWVGNKTEHGLLGFVNLVQRSYKDMRASVPEDAQRQFPFNSKKKRMTTVVRGASGAVTGYCKGASEIILEQCDRYLDANGDVQKLDDARKAGFMDVINDMANQGNRTIGIAYYDMVGQAALPEEEPDEAMIFMGVMGIQDPIRREVPAAVLRCQSAGVTVRMVTGDNINTAIAIAKKCNIFTEPAWDIAMTGEEFRKMFKENKAALLEKMPRLRVLARSSPQDKYIMVGLLQEIGEVVGVTGDGTNDAPALKLANVGFAMHIGTDIAKGASDMILLDNNFASVVNAIRWGRAVNDNVRKFLQYQLSINVGGVILTVVGSLASPTSKEPLAAVHLLWLNLIMDTLAALALATELPDDHAMARLPVFKQAPLISRRMWLFIMVHAVYQTALTLAILFSGHNWMQTIENRDRCDHEFPKIIETVNVTQLDLTTRQVLIERDDEMTEYCRKLCTDEGGVMHGLYCQQGRVHGTLIFNIFIWFQIFNMFNGRKLYAELNPFEGIWSRSRIFLIVWWVIVGFQVFAVEVADRFLSTVRLSWYYWLISVGFGLTEFIVGLVINLLPVRNPIPVEVREKFEREQDMRRALNLAVESRSLEDMAEGRAKTVVHDPVLRRKQSVHRKE